MEKAFVLPRWRGSMVTYVRIGPTTYQFSSEARCKMATATTLTVLSMIAAAMGSVSTSWLSQLGAALDDMMRYGDSLWQQALAIAPALAVLLPIILILPLLALASGLAMWLTRTALRQWRQVQPLTGDERIREVPAALAVVGIDGVAPVRVSSHRPIVRIGRQDDNDICVTQDTVHRYHAIVQRTAEAEFWIHDLSGPNGNGVRLNGERVASARVGIGDRIEIGGLALALENGSVAERDEVRPADRSGPTLH